MAPTVPLVSPKACALRPALHPFFSLLLIALLVTALGGCKAGGAGSGATTAAPASTETGRIGASASSDEAAKKVDISDVGVVWSSQSKLILDQLRYYGEVEGQACHEGDTSAARWNAYNAMRRMAKQRGYNFVYIIGCDTRSYTMDCGGRTIICEGQFAKGERIWTSIGAKQTAEFQRMYMQENVIEDVAHGIWNYVDDSVEFLVGEVSEDSDFADEYDMMGVAIRSKNDYWDKGDVIMLLGRTATEGIYRLRLVLGSGVALDTTATIKGNLLRINHKGLSVSQALRNHPRDPRIGTRVASSGGGSGGGGGSTSEGATADGDLEILGSGTGWLSPQGYVVTNAHVIAEGNSYAAYNTKTDELIILRKKTVDAHNDIALLVPLDEDVCKLPPALPLAADAPYLGQEVFTVGYPMFGAYKAASPQFTTGIVSALDGLKGDRRYIQMTVPIQPGNSGGPLINKAGQVVGLTTAKVNDMHSVENYGTVMQNMNFSIKVAYLKALLETLPKQKVCNGIRQASATNVNAMGAKFADTSLLIVTFK